MNAAVDKWILAHTDELSQWRRHIHANPELARHEYATTEFVATRLAAAGLSPELLPGGTGLTCDLGPSDGPRIALRADIDALPLQELTGATYSSTVPGVSHACGHDAHTTILLGTGLALSEIPDLPVGVRLIFQPAEEVMPGGALEVVAAGRLEGVSRIFALHCDPRLAAGRVGVRLGAITSAADTIEVVLDSPGGHTSRPHLTTDLVFALGTVVTGLPGMLSRRIDPRTGTVMVWGAVSAGRAPNAIPQTGMMTGTVRTGDQARQQRRSVLLVPQQADSISSHSLRNSMGVLQCIADSFFWRFVSIPAADEMVEELRSKMWPAPQQSYLSIVQRCGGTRCKVI